MRKVAGRSVMAGLAIAMLMALVACGGNNDEMPVPPEVEAEIAERIAPAGEVAMASEVVTAPAAASGGARSGDEIYNTKCMICHASGTAGAPILGNASDWAPRIGKGIEALYTNSISGFNGMPAKGLCMDCSDDELKATVDYMVEKSQ